MAIAIAILVAEAMWWIQRHDWFEPLLWGTWMVAALVYRARPPTIVDANGIRRPWRRRSRIGWGDVQSVVAPQPGIASVRILLGNGSTVVLGDILIANTSAVAALGGKEVVAPPRPRVSPTPSRAPTDAAIAADVARRARALRRQREALAEEARHLHS